MMEKNHPSSAVRCEHHAQTMAQLQLDAEIKFENACKELTLGFRYGLCPRKIHILNWAGILACSFIYSLRLPIPLTVEQWPGTDFAFWKKKGLNSKNPFLNFLSMKKERDCCLQLRGSDGFSPSSLPGQAQKHALPSRFGSWVLT
jgi:hypothetical protein